MSRSNVVAIGCYTRDWGRGLQVRPSVMRELEKDPPLWRVLEQALARHGSKLPTLLRRGDLRHTRAWLSRKPRRDVVIRTECNAVASLSTLIYHADRSREF